MAVPWDKRSLDDALRSAIDQSDVPVLLQLVQQVVQHAGKGLELSPSLGTAAMCLMGQKQLSVKVAGYLFYESLARGCGRLPLLDSVGVLGINTLRKDAYHASPAVRAAAVRAAFAVGVAPSVSGELASSAREVTEGAVADTSSFVRRAASLAYPRICNGGDAVPRLQALVLDPDPFVSINAQIALGQLQESRAVGREQCFQLLDGLEAGVYPEFCRATALKLACHYQITDSQSQDLYHVLDRLDALLQSQDACVAVAALGAFASYMVHLPASARRDAFARLAEACQRLAVHPDPHVVGAVLQWLIEQPDIALYAEHLADSLSLFFCRPSDGISLRRKKMAVLVRIAELTSSSTVADVTAHVLSEIGTGSGALSSSALAAVAQLAGVPGCRDVCRASVGQYLQSCSAVALASAVGCWHELEGLVTPEGRDRALDVLSAPSNRRLLNDCSVAAALAGLVGERSDSFAAGRDVIELLAGIAFADASAPGSAPPTQVQLAVVAAAVKCYFRHPSVANRQVLGHVFGRAASCSSVIVKEQALLYFRLLREDREICRALLLGTEKEDESCSKDLSSGSGTA